MGCQFLFRCGVNSAPRTQLELLFFSKIVRVIPRLVCGGSFGLSVDGLIYCPYVAESKRSCCRGWEGMVMGGHVEPNVSAYGL